MNCIGLDLHFNQSFSSSIVWLFGKLIIDLQMIIIYSHIKWFNLLIQLINVWIIQIYFRNSVQITACDNGWSSSFIVVVDDNALSGFIYHLWSLFRLSKFFSLSRNNFKISFFLILTLMAKNFTTGRFFCLFFSIHNRCPALMRR